MLVQEQTIIVIELYGLLNWHYKPMVYRFVYAQDAKKNFGKNWD